ncbi:Isopentenyl-diphosphate Delta-isomerase [uncultured archaeon]|nr:Isopentenyl-diphosphate Delta-isomerase [uncultured archaeon]
MEEIFDVVDENDNVTGQKPRSQVHAEKLLHRSTLIIIENSKGEILLQLRGDKADTYPGWYTTSAAGHVTAGGTYYETAHRELKEELGIDTKLKPIKKIPGTINPAKEFMYIYAGNADGPFKYQEKETAGGTFITKEELIKNLKTGGPLKITPAAELALKAYFESLNKK